MPRKKIPNATTLTKPEPANEALRKDVSELRKVLIATDRQELPKSFGMFFHDAWENVLEPHVAFKDSPHYELLFEYAQLLGTGEFKKRFPDKKGIMICIPPRTLKSKIFTIALPAWIWTFAPWKKFLCLTYSEELAAPFSQDRRNLIQSPWYQKRFKLDIRDDQNEKRRYENDKGGFCFSSSAQATGFGGNFVILDDLLNARFAYSKARRQQVNKFWDDALTTRRNDPSQDVYLIIMQRLHSNDLVGHLTAKEKDEWVIVDIPMEAEETRDYVFPISGKVWTRVKGDILVPEMNTKQYIAGEKRNSKKWNAQFQQRPSPPGGFIFNPDKWIPYDKAPDTDLQVLSVDCAWKSGKANDKVGLMVLGVDGPNRHILSWRHEHMTYNQILDAIRQYRREYPKISYVLVEEAANGYAVIKQLSEEMPGLVGVLPKEDKEARAHSASSDLESGHVFVPNPETNTLVQSEIIDTFAEFQGDGSVEFDDLIDAFTQAINWLRSRYWGTEHIDKQYAELSKSDKPPETGDTCPGCGKSTVVREGSAWMCGGCGSNGRGSRRTIIKPGF